MLVGPDFSRLLPTSILIGAAFLLLAIVITVACISGRYHFIVDCALGAAVAVMVWIVTGPPP